ncbi:glycosyltransferase [Pseudoalteromonas rhizosphaerae]|uniref:glycosyltransferase n=1 Tax=Pseudoalteromonas rhizosphaerae TaxID=2518973 RepID=UPI002149321E|nr:glycosyltransferase [Pseudoalteromonas rhizosphaerae]
MNEINLTIIIYSNLSIAGGGRETWLANFINSKELLSSFKSLTVLSATSSKELGTPIKFPDNIIHKSIDVSHVNNIKRIANFSKFCAKFVKQVDREGEKHVVICLGSYIESIAGFFACKNTRACRITWIRGVLEKELAQRHSGAILEVFKFLEVFLLKRNQLVLSNGKDTAAFYEEKGIASEVVNNGIHLNNFYQSQTGEKIRLGFVGRLNLEKGIDYFTDCLSELTNEKNLEVIVAGDGSQKEILQRVQKQLKGKVNISYLGVVDNYKIPELLAHLDISCHLTGTKILGGGGVSHSLIEAMVSGNRVICWDNEIFRQVEGFQNFFSAKEGSKDELLRCLRAAIQNARDEKGPSQAMIDAAQGYSFYSHIQRFLEIVNKHIKL